MVLKGIALYLQKGCMERYRDHRSFETCSAALITKGKVVVNMGRAFPSSFDQSIVVQLSKIFC